MPVKKKAAKKKAATKNCPVCAVHSKDQGRFYDKPPKIGKIVASGKCSVCGYVEGK